MPARIVILATAFACLSMSQPPRSFAAELQVDPAAMPRILPMGPDEALKSFTVKAGFHLEIAACEPLVVDPVTMCFDEQGRLFVVEMIDYSERREEDPHLGRVRMLTDSDGDGRYDQASVYADRLPWPTALVCYDGGVFIGATPDILWCRDNDGDGRADERKVVFTGFGAKASRLNVQALFNSFQWGLDNRIHGTCGTIDGTEVTRPDRPDIAPLRLNRVDFSFDPKRLDIRPETGGGQYGMSFDSAGRKFLCSNSDHAQTAMYEYRDSGRNPLFQLPSHRVSIAEEGRAAEVFRLSPDEPWRVIRTRWRISGVVRGVVEGGGRVSGYFTGASGLTVYQGDSYGPEFSDNLFIGDAGGNLVHRKLVDHSTLPPVARRPADERDREFIASRDNWFRPVHFANGPDGCLYIADMYRETIEHPWSLPEPIKQHLDLNSGNDRGRIYRVVKDGFEHPGRPDLGAKSDRELIRSLGSPNGWVRNTASRVLYQRAEAGIASVIKGEWESMPALGKVHALHLLSATGQLDGRDMARGLADTDERVRLNALRTISEEPLSSELRESVAAMSEDASRAVRYQLALTLSRIEMPDRSQILKRLLLRDEDNEWMRAVVFNAVRDDFAGLASALGKTEAPSSIPLARMAGMSGKTKEIEALLKMIDSRWGESGIGAILTALDEGLKGRGDRLFKHLSGNPLAERFEKLKERLTDTGVPREERLEGIRKLSAAGYDFSGGALVGLLVAHSNAEIRQGVVTALLGMTEPGAFDALLTRWSRLDPAIRRSVVRHALGNRTRTRVLLAKVKEGTIERAAFDSVQVTSLRTNRDKNIAGLAMALFGEAKTESNEELVKRYQASLVLPGNVESGRKVFAERCVSCHRANGEGFPLGPDLVTVKAKGREDLLKNILNPNAEVAPQYIAFEVDTLDDESFTAILGDESPTHVTLKMAGGVARTLVRKAVKGMRSSGKSLMPEGLHEGLSAEQMADLLRFIAASN